MSEIEKRVKALLKKVRIGRRGSAAKRAARQLMQGFDRFGIDFVFDVGANRGQFAQQIRAAGFSGRIVSFEPLSDAHEKLRQAATRDVLWSVHDRCALGDSDGSTVIHI